MTNSIVLTSGGLDSAVALALEVQEYKQSVTPVFFNYGQKNLESELASVNKLSSKFGITGGVAEIQLPVLVDIDDDVIARNTIFLAIATNLAASYGATRIVTGLRDGPFFDTQEGFLAAQEGLLGAMAHSRLEFSHPVYYMTKKEVITKAKEFEIFDKTYSCFRGNEPCGECDTCKEIENALK